MLSVLSESLNSSSCLEVLCLKVVSCFEEALSASLLDRFCEAASSGSESTLVCTTVSSERYRTSKF